MSAISYTSLHQQVIKFHQLGLVARALDSIESFMVIQRASMLNLSAAGFYRAMARQDAQTAWGREQAAFGRVLSCHAWFAQSQHSIEQLSLGAEAWGRANEMSNRTADAMREVINRPRQWEGAGAEGQKQKAMDQLRAQNELTEVTRNLRLGCEATRLVMTNVFLELALSLFQSSLAVTPSALRAPSALTGLFSMNSRVKSVAVALERVASDYEAVRNGRGWRAQSNGLADTFSENGARLAAVTTALKMSMMPLLA